MAQAPLPNALERFATIEARLGGRQLVMALDYDGTLAPIADRPDDACLTPGMREALADLAGLCPTAVVSGRDRAALAARLDLPGLYYAGSHGFDIAGPRGLSWEHPEAAAILESLDQAEAWLETELAGYPGALVERKRFAVSVHHRLARPSDIHQIDNIVNYVLARLRRLRKTHGKMVFELRPDIAWHKGAALGWLLAALGLEPATALPVYVGDDLTDEDAFETLRTDGIGIIVDPPERPTAASLSLASTEEVEELLRRLAGALRRERAHA